MVSTAKVREEVKDYPQSKLRVLYKSENEYIEFSPLEAFNKGVLGKETPTVTEQGVESIMCCNGIVAPG
jgi:hypothetical protein